MTAPSTATKPTKGSQPTPGEAIVDMVSAAIDEPDAPRGNPEAGPDERYARIPLDKIQIGGNVRTSIEGIDELAATIAEHGLLQPIRVIGPFADNGEYTLVAGQRRVLACRKLGWETIPAVVVQPGSMGPDTGRRRSVQQLVENLQREDIGPLETAAALKVLVASGLTQTEIAKGLGRSDAWVSNTMGLLDSTPKVQEYVAGGKLSASHVKAIVTLPKAEQEQMATNAVNSRWSSHELESQVEWYRDRTERQKSETAAASTKNAEAGKRIVADLIKRKATKADPIVVGGEQSGWAVDALRKSGYSSVTESRESYFEGRPGGGLCDCRAWRVQTAWNGGATLGQACIVKAHQKAGQKARDERANEKQQDERTAYAAIEATLAAERSLLKAGGLTLRILAARLMGYGIDQWSEGRAKATRKRDRNWLALRDASDEDLIAEIVKRLGVPSEVSSRAIAADLDRFGGQTTLLGAIAAGEEAAEPAEVQP